MHNSSSLSSSLSDVIFKLSLSEVSLPIVTTYKPNGFIVFTLVKNTIGSLNSDNRLQSLLPKVNIINSKRQAANLKKILTRAKFTDKTKPVGFKGSVSKCCDQRCGTCPVILEGAQYTLNESGATLFVNTYRDCTARMVLYVIKYSGCNSVYIGSTKHLPHRVSLHRSHIKRKHNRTCPVSEHLDICGRGKFKIFPFLKMTSESEVLNYAIKSTNYPFMNYSYRGQAGIIIPTIVIK